MFVIVFFGFFGQELTSVSYILQKWRKNGKERSFERFKTSIECDRMFTLVISEFWLIFELNTGTHRKNRFGDKGFDSVKYSGVKPMFWLLSLCTKTAYIEIVLIKDAYIL